MIKLNFLNKFHLSMPYPPPPPPKPKKSRTLFAVIAVVLVAILLIPALFLTGIVKLPGSPSTSPVPTSSPFVTSTPIHTSSPGTNPIVTSTASPSLTPGRIDMVKTSTTQATSQTVDSSGGTIQVTDSSSPLNGLKISVPAAATTEPISFAVSYSTISSITGLPSSSSVASKLISIETSGSATFNQYKMFEKPVQVTLPYDSSVINDDNSPVRFYWYDSQTGKLDSAGFLSQNPAAHTITFLTGSFSDFVAVRTMLSNAGSAWGIDVPVDTGFRPARDGWYIPNYGSYLTSGTLSTTGGFCLGMVSYAKWYYTNIATGMQSKYIEGAPNEWRDDKTAIQLAARAHLATSGIWTSLTQEEQDWATANAREVALSWISGMLVTGEPQLIGLKAQLPNGTWLDYAHAVMTYSYGNGKFEIYDPNFPATQPGDTMREIPFTYQNGFSEVYISGTTRADSLRFNIFYHAGSKLSATPNDYRGLYDSAEIGFQGNSQFPEVKLTDANSSPVGSTPTDNNGDGVRDTTDAKTTISGTITGGVTTITSTLIYVNNQKYQAAVVNGEFSKEVPLMAGDNNVAILVTDVNTFDKWAGFLSDTIKSSASPAAMTITLTWDQDTSDVDLHMLEPGIDGRHIFYNNPGSADIGPYLDIDNTHGYGPEHYYATESMTLPGATSLYGTYQVRVNYYADHSGTEQPQTISWHLNIKYLAFKDLQTGQEYWVEGSRSGVILTPDSSSTEDFQNSSPAWSSIWTIEYAAPNPQDYSIPPPPQNVFPTPAP